MENEVLGKNRLPNMHCLCGGAHKVGNNAQKPRQKNYAKEKIQ